MRTFEIITFENVQYRVKKMGEQIESICYRKSPLHIWQRLSIYRWREILKLISKEKS